MSTATSNLQTPITTSGSGTTSASSAFTLTENDLSHLRSDPSKFQAKAWLSSCWFQLQQAQQQQQSASTTTTTTNQNISKIYLALQLQAQECTSSLDDISNQLLTRVPRAMVEIERCDNEVAGLRENLNKSKTSTSSVEVVIPSHPSSTSSPGNAAADSTTANTTTTIDKNNEEIRSQVEAATSKIKSMQVARQRLHHCKTVLAEWNSLSKKAEQVEKTVESFVSSSSSSSGSSSSSNVTFSSIASDIAALRKSIEIIEKVEPSVVKQAHAKVSSIETKFQKYTESDVLATLTRALSNNNSTSASSTSITITSAQEESLRAIITIGKMPELLEKSFSTLSASRTKKYTQELTTILSTQNTSSSTASTAIRKVYHSIAKNLLQDIENLNQLFAKITTTTTTTTSEEGGEVTTTSSTMILSNSYRSTLEVTDNDNFKSIVAKILETKMKTDESLSCGSKVLSDLNSTLLKLSSMVAKQNQQSQKQQHQILSGCFREPFEDVMEHLEQYEKEMLFNPSTIGNNNSNNSSSSWQEELQRFSKLSDAIVNSATRTGRDWAMLIPDGSLRVAPLWSGALSMWTQHFIAAVKQEQQQQQQNRNSSSDSESILKTLLEIHDASKSLPERAINLENLLDQQQQQQEQDVLAMHPSSSSEQNDSNTTNSSSIVVNNKKKMLRETFEKIKDILKDGLENVKSIERDVKNIFLAQLMLPASKLLQEFISVSFGADNQTDKKQQQQPSSSNNNDKMPSEAIRALGSWLMELPMLLETIGADTAKWTGVAAESLVASFVKDVNARANAKNNNSLCEQLKTDVEYFENVLQAVDDRLEISSKIQY